MVFDTVLRKNLLQIYWDSEQQDFENDTKLDRIATGGASVPILSLSVLFLAQLVTLLSAVIR